MSGRMLPPAKVQRLSPDAIRRFRYTAWWARWNEPSPRCSIVCAWSEEESMKRVRSSVGLGAGGAGNAALRVEEVGGRGIEGDADLVAGVQRAAGVLARDE